MDRVERSKSLLSDVDPTPASTGPGSAAGKALVIRMSPPEATQAVPRAARTLRSMGYDVTILSFTSRADAAAPDFLDGMPVVWHAYPYKPGDAASFARAWVSWWRFVFAHLRGNEYDLVQASNLESMVPCVGARQFGRFPLVFDIRDLWGMSVGESHRNIARVMRWFERWAARRSDGMVLAPAPLDLMADYFGPSAAERVPIAQVINVPAVDLAGGFTPLPEGPFRLNYSGHISYRRNAGAIIEFAKANPDVQVDVVGSVPDERLAAEFASVPNIACHGRVSLERAMELMAEAHLVALMYDVSTPIAVVSTPNKMFEALMLSRPYVACTGGFPAEVAEQQRVGWAIPYDDADALSDLVRRLKEDPQQVAEAARRARELYEDRFEWVDQERNLTDLYNYVSSDKAAATSRVAGWAKVVGTTIQSRWPANR